MSQPKQLTFRPYARLLTMLGEQLIKDERVALVELIKNAYDADADWVKVSFEGFSDSWKASEKSRIVIEDNGTGMTESIIRDAWMNPASFSKKNLPHLSGCAKSMAFPSCRGSSSAWLLNSTISRTGAAVPFSRKR